MPKRDKSGPPKGSTGPRNSKGKGKGNYSKTGKGIGTRKGGRAGNCKK